MLHALNGVARFDIWNGNGLIDFLEEKLHMYIRIPGQIYLDSSTTSLNSLEEN